MKMILRNLINVLKRFRLTAFLNITGNPVDSIKAE